MIIVCPECRASFLVSAAAFRGGERRVRCGRCRHEWSAAPTKKTPSSLFFEKTAGVALDENVQNIPTAAPPFDFVAAPFSPFFGSKKQKDAPDISQGNAGALTNALPPERQGRPIAHFFQRRFVPLARLGLFIAIGATLFSLSGALAGYRYIVRTWPQALPYYQTIGFGAPLELTSDSLVLRSIQAERRYADGAMRLFVKGQVFNGTGKSQLIPAIRIEALGPDGSVIERWHIPAPNATVKAGDAFPFVSSIPSPEGTVAEVNLSFVEQHDEKR